MVRRPWSEPSLIEPVALPTILSQLKE